MKYLLFFTCLLSLKIAASQRVIDVEKIDRVDISMFNVVAGQPVVNAKFVRLTDGTPFFKDYWTKGNVVLKNDQITASSALKLDLLDNELYYLAPNGAEMIATTPVKEILLRDTITGASYHFFHASLFPATIPSKKVWSLELIEGKASLYQSFHKQIQEHKAYGSATVEQRIRTSEEFFILYNNTILPVKKAKEIPSVLPGKTKELESFLTTLRGSEAEKLIAVVKYYNSLFQ